MFRAAAAGPFEEVVAKATDENSTSEDWGAIIEVCDKVAADPNGPKEAVQSMIRRLAHRNANVQLYTLELAHALCQNCGKEVHREIASRAFSDALLKLANDRNTHNQVKTKILEKLQEWSTMFRNEPDLGIMYDAYFRLKQSNPTLQAPSAPQKQGLTSLDRQKEEDELQMALKLSLQDEERKRGSQAGPSPQAGPGAQQQATVPVSTALPSGTTAATVSRVRALFDFVPTEPGELEFKKGDVIAVLESVYKDWWRGSLKGKTGIFPLNYVEKLTDPTPEELQREAQMEAEVFAEIKNVEKLLTLLSASNTTPREEDNEEISKLYHQTLAIRPKLIKLIEKYSQKKDDFTQLNEKFIKARRDYEALLESSMSHPPQHNYHQYATRPGPQAQGHSSAGSGPSYPGQQQQQQQQQPQDPQRYYTPAPGNQYQTSSPPPSFQPYTSPRQSQQSMPPQQAAPFYVAGTEVPPQAPGGQHPPPGDSSNANSAGARDKPLPPNLTTSPTPIHNYIPYSQPPSAQSQANAAAYLQQPPWQRASTHGAQELATSVYDSPSDSNNPNSANTYTSSAYSQDDDNPPNNQANAPPPPAQYPQKSPYQGFHPGSADALSAVPAPLQVPSSGAFDARQRQSLPTPSQNQSQSQSGNGPQYTPYAVDSGDASAPSAPAASDYYRQPGVY